MQKRAVLLRIIRITVTYLTVVAAVSGILWAAGCGREDLPVDREQARVFTVEIGAAGTEEIGKRLAFSGEITPLRQVVVAPPLPGRVVAIKVKEGERVREDQVLIRMENTQQELQLRQATAAVKAARIEVEKLAHLVEEGVVAEYMLRNARSELEQSEAALDLAQYAYDVTFLKSPLDGVVGYIWAGEGELVGNTEVVLVMDVDRVLVRLIVDETQLANLVVDMPVQVEVPAVGGVFRPGKVSSLGQVAVPGTRSFPVQVELDNADGTLKPGMFARLIVESDSRRAVMVPGSALREESGEAFLFIVSGDRAVQRVVQTGLRQDGKVEIVRGLDPGEQYILKVPAGIEDGSTIETGEVR